MDLKSNMVFRQATIHICGNLDINKAMRNFLDYIKDYIPIDNISLRVFDPNLNVLKSIASVDCRPDNMVSEVLPMPDRILAERIMQWEKIKPIEIINRPALHQDIGQMLPKVGRGLDCSIIVMRIDQDTKHIGNLSVLVKGNDHYTNEHAQFFQMLHDPFAIALANACKHQELIRLNSMISDDNFYLQQKLQQLSNPEIVGTGLGLRQVMDKVRLVAPLNCPVLLTGETGVGKDMIAKAIHDASPRKKAPFVKVNCGALPDTLIDSELFGYEKGAFTGANTRKMGRFERANGGTIFLDEIGELPLQAQVRLLHVLQTHEIERVGGSTSIPMDIRILLATHRNLKSMIDSGGFREDLWYRINVFPIEILPLRRRKNDIPNLVNFFIEKKCIEFKQKQAPMLAPGAMDRLMEYEWPGNVRELKNVIERAMILQCKGPISFNDLVPASRTNGNVSGTIAQEEFVPKPLNSVITHYIQQILNLTNGKVEGPNGAAELLEIHPNTLRGRMKKMGIPYGRKTG